MTQSGVKCDMSRDFISMLLWHHNKMYTFGSRTIYSLSITGGIVVFTVAVVLYLGIDIQKR